MSDNLSVDVNGPVVRLWKIYADSRPDEWSIYDGGCDCPSCRGFRLRFTQWLAHRAEDFEREATALRAAIHTHHAQKADDRCIFDDDQLYAAAGLPPVDRRVGDKFAMAQNCMRYIDRRCEEGGWPTYVELEAELCRWRTLGKRLMQTLDLHDVAEELERLTSGEVT